MSYASSTEELSRWSRIQNSLASHVMHENPYANIESPTPSPGCPVCLSMHCSINHVKSVYESFHNWGTLPREQQTTIVENMYSSVPLLHPFARYTRQELKGQIASLFRQKFSRLGAIYHPLPFAPCNIDLVVAGLDMTQIPQNIVDQATLLALHQGHLSENNPNDAIADVLAKHGTTSAPTTTTSSCSTKAKQKRASVATKLSEGIAFDADWLIHDALRAKRERENHEHTDKINPSATGDENPRKGKGTATPMSDWCVVSLTVTRYLYASLATADSGTALNPDTDTDVGATDGASVGNVARKIDSSPGKVKTKDEELVAATIIYEKNVLIRNSMAYRSGYLAFREAVPVLSMLLDLYKTHMEINDIPIPGKTPGNSSFSGNAPNSHCLWPDVIVIDGNGVLHPHKCGLASHVGVLLNTPTVGVGKTLCHVEQVNKDMDERARGVVAGFRCALTAPDVRGSLPVQACADAYVPCSEALFSCMTESYPTANPVSVETCAETDASIHTYAGSDAAVCDCSLMDAPTAESGSVCSRSIDNRANTGSNGHLHGEGCKTREEVKSCMLIEAVDKSAGQQLPAPLPVLVSVPDRHAYVGRKSLAELLSAHMTTLLSPMHNDNSGCSGKDTAPSFNTIDSATIGNFKGKPSCPEPNPEEITCQREEYLPYMMETLSLLPPPCYPLLGKPTYIHTATRTRTLNDRNACARTSTGAATYERISASDAQVAAQADDSHVSFLYGMGVHANWIHTVQTTLLAHIKEQERCIGGYTRTQASVPALLNDLCNVPRAAPVYVSIGSHIHMREALLLVLSTSVVKVPEATRSADMIGRACVRELRGRIDAGDETVINKCT